MLVYLRSKKGDEGLSVHPSYATRQNAQIQLTIGANRITPRVCPIQTTQTLVVKNLARDARNPNIMPPVGQGINPLLKPHQTAQTQFTRACPRPFPISMNIKPHDPAYVLPTDHPYVDVSDASGEFEIQYLPAGTHTFTIWHERSDDVDEVTVNIEPPKWKRGQVAVEIAAGTRDLGEIRLSAEMFR